LPGLNIPGTLCEFACVWLISVEIIPIANCDRTDVNWCPTKQDNALIPFM
jgi:hypothetical protein